MPIDIDLLLGGLTSLQNSDAQHCSAAHWPGCAAGLWNSTSQTAATTCRCCPGPSCSGQAHGDYAATKVGGGSHLPLANSGGEEGCLLDPCWLIGQVDCLQQHHPACCSYHPACSSPPVLPPTLHPYLAPLCNRDIPDADGYIFTSDWVSHVASSWQSHLSHLAGQPIRALEVGSYEGRSAVWFITHLLQHPDAHLTCIDGLAYRDSSGRHHVHDRFVHNVLEKHPGKATLIREWSETALKRLALEGQQQFELIYIDANHIARAVLEDSVLSFPLLKTGGILILDDYRWADLPAEAPHHPKHGADAFLTVYGPGMEVLHKGYQVIMRKRS